MKKLVLILIAMASLPALVAGQVVEEIVTRVNGQIITRSEYDRSKDQLRDDVKQQDPANADKLYAEREKDVLRDLVDQQLLLEKGKDLGITGDTELIKRLDSMRKDMKLDTMEELEKAATAQGISYEDFKQNLRNQIITQKVIGEEVGSHLSITKEEEQQFYDAHKSELEQPESI
ncbi:MAG: SurA N-terminal domain-containing protein, partial [Candidatus Sulfotelmatobacter sp.]